MEVALGCALFLNDCSVVESESRFTRKWDCERKWDYSFSSMHSVHMKNARRASNLTMSTHHPLTQHLSTKECMYGKNEIRVFDVRVCP